MVDYTNQDHGCQGQEVLDLVSDCKGSVRNDLGTVSGVEEGLGLVSDLTIVPL